MEGEVEIEIRGGLLSGWNKVLWTLFWLAELIVEVVALLVIGLKVWGDDGKTW